MLKENTFTSGITRASKGSRRFFLIIAVLGLLNLCLEGVFFSRLAGDQNEFFSVVVGDDGCREVREVAGLEQ